MPGNWAANFIWLAVYLCFITHSMWAWLMPFFWNRLKQTICTFIKILPIYWSYFNQYIQEWQALCTLFVNVNISSLAPKAVPDPWIYTLERSVWWAPCPKKLLVLPGFEIFCKVCHPVTNAINVKEHLKISILKSKSDWST